MPKLIYYANLTAEATAPWLRGLPLEYVQDPVTYIMRTMTRSLMANGARDHDVILSLMHGCEPARDRQGSVVRNDSGQWVYSQSACGFLQCLRDGFVTLAEPYGFATAIRFLRRQVGVRSIWFYPGPMDQQFLDLTPAQRIEALSPYIYALNGEPGGFYWDGGSLYGEHDPRFTVMKEIDAFTPLPARVEGRPSAGCPNLADRGSITTSGEMKIGQYNDPKFLPVSQLTGPRAVLDLESKTTPDALERARHDLREGYDVTVPWWADPAVAASMEQVIASTPVGNSPQTPPIS